MMIVLKQRYLEMIVPLNKDLKPLTTIIKVGMLLILSMSTVTCLLHSDKKPLFDNATLNFDFITRHFQAKDNNHLEYLETSNSKPHPKNMFYRLINQPIQSSCKIFKKIAGIWNNQCGFFDGEKIVCMENLYEAIQNGSCLIYSFGLADDWDFEVTLAKLGISFQMRQLKAI